MSLMDYNTKLKVNRLETIKRLQEERDRRIAKAKKDYDQALKKYEKYQVDRAAYTEWLEDQVKSGKAKLRDSGITQFMDGSIQLTQVFEVKGRRKQQPAPVREPGRLDHYTQAITEEYQQVIKRLEMSVDETLTIRVADLDYLL